MIDQRHPADRVTPVEVGDPIAWTQDGPLWRGSTPGRSRYLVGPLDDVWQAVRIDTVPAHAGSARDLSTIIRHCVDAATAKAACQDAEHVHAWATLSETARQLLLARYVEGVAA